MIPRWPLFVDPFDRLPAPSGYVVKIGSRNDLHRIDVWPADESPSRVALVLLSRNGVPVSSWMAPFLPKTKAQASLIGTSPLDAMTLWLHYQQFRGNASDPRSRKPT